jgi:hypothetical protein
MKKLLGIVAACGCLAIPATASAGDSTAYGRAIQDCFGTTYGQAKNAAWESGHATKPALGAKLTAIAHGCVEA